MRHGLMTDFDLSPDHEKVQKRFYWGADVLLICHSSLFSFKTDSNRGKEQTKAVLCGLRRRFYAPKTFQKGPKSMAAETRALRKGVPPQITIDGCPPDSLSCRNHPTLSQWTKNILCSPVLPRHFYLDWVEHMYHLVYAFHERTASTLWNISSRYCQTGLDSQDRISNRSGRIKGLQPDSPGSTHLGRPSVTIHPLDDSLCAPRFRDRDRCKVTMHLLFCCGSGRCIPKS